MDVLVDVTGTTVVAVSVNVTVLYTVLSAKVKLIQLLNNKRIAALNEGFMCLCV